MLYGIEFEVGIPCPRESFYNDSERSYFLSRAVGVDTSFWEVGKDSSIFFPERDGKTYRGFELRNREPVTLEVLAEQISDLLPRLRSIGRVNNTCGLHIHVSCPNRELIEDEADKMVDLLRLGTYEIKQIFRNRREYCDQGRFSRKEKYCPVRIVDERCSHVEFRVFNGSLNSRYVARCLSLVRQIFSEVCR